MKSKIFIITLIGVTLGYGQTYSKLVEKIRYDRDSIYMLYTAADNPTKKDIIKATRQYLLATIKDSLFSYWYCTPWDFYGTTRVPRQGKIACGYFVTTILNDAGFKIPIKWAQLASEDIILRFLPDKLQRFVNKPLSDAESYLLAEGDGLYLTGLDCHVGFLYVTKDTLLFIHSNYFYPEIGVMSESVETVNPFRFSKYRVISKLLSDPMVVSWIRSESFK